MFTGVSGPAKSSLAFDTIYAEGQGAMSNPCGVCPPVPDRMMEKSPTSTTIEGPVAGDFHRTESGQPQTRAPPSGRVTEIHTYLAPDVRPGGLHPAVPTMMKLSMPRRCRRWSIPCWQCPKASKLMLLAPVVRNRKSEHVQLLENLRAQDLFAPGSTPGH